MHSALAIGDALKKWGYRPYNPSKVWIIINPDDDFAGCRDYMRNQICIPPMFLLREGIVLGRRVGLVVFSEDDVGQNTRAKGGVREGRRVVEEEVGEKASES